MGKAYADEGSGVGKRGGGGGGGGGGQGGQVSPHFKKRGGAMNTVLFLL